MSGSQGLGLGEIVDVRANVAWATEVTFSKWLADNLSRLSDMLGVSDLDLIGTELAVGDFRCDIVAREVGSGCNMVIENQFSKTDHDHLGKLLTYAAQHSAEIVVWISSDIRDEHRAAIDWMNKITGGAIGFFAVQLRVIVIDGSKPAPLFDVRASPNVWVKPTSNSTEAGVSPRNELYRQFFQLLIDDLRARRFTNAKAAQPQSWYSFASGTKRFNYTVEFSSGNRMRAGLYIDLGHQQANKAAYQIFEDKKSEIQVKLKTDLAWELLPHRRASRLAVERTNSNIEQASANAPEARNWLVEQLLSLKSVLSPLLPQAAAAADLVLSSPEPNLETADGTQNVS